MPFDNTKIIRIAGICGILAPIIAFACIGTAILISPWFSFTDNWLSDLGGRPDSDSIWATYGSVSIIFNIGLMTAGILGTVFAVGFRKSGMVKTPYGKAGTELMFLVTASFFGIGLFTESTGELHVIVSVAFFAFAGLCVIFVGIALIKSSEKALVGFVFGLLAFGLISVPLLMIPKPLGSNAIAEIIPIISISLFVIVFSIKLLKLDSSSNQDQ